MRKSFYLTTTWILIGCVLLCASFFTYFNGFKKISFSFENNDVYSISRELLSEGVLKDDHYQVGWTMDLTHIDERYIRVITDGISNKEVSLLITAGVYDESGVFIPRCEIKDTNLQNGINDYEIKAKDNTVAIIEISGASTMVLKEVQFRESIKPIAKREAMIVLSLTAALYLVLTYICIVIARNFQKSKNKVKQRNDKLHNQEFNNTHITCFGDYGSVSTLLPNDGILNTA